MRTEPTQRAEGGDPGGDGGEGAKVAVCSANSREQNATA